MPDNRDFRIIVDLTFDSTKKGVARGLYNHAKAQVAKAININPGSVWEEIGYVELHRCGHGTGKDCTLIEKEEVP